MIDHQPCNSQWQKLGLIFCPSVEFPWMHSHASHPTAESLGGGDFKIYFNTRDKDNRSSVAYLILNISNPQKILDLSSEPVLSPGDVGYFDDSGVQIGSIEHNLDGDSYLYYLGWNLGVTVPWRNSIGVAIRKRGQTIFEKLAEVPILDRSIEDPLTLSYPWVIRKGSKWQMWYGSHKAWKTDGFDMIHVLKYAESDNGLSWRRNDYEILPLNLKDGEFAISRPSVIETDGGYRMSFSARYKYYRIGFAKSHDGITWQRDESRPLLSCSQTGWDSQSVEYASIFRYSGREFLLYNGNNFGATGFGLAFRDV